MVLLLQWLKLPMLLLQMKLDRLLVVVGVACVAQMMLLAVA